MNDLTKNEVVKMAKAAHGPITAQWWDMDVAALQRFYDLARADLVAEVERLKAVIDGKQDLWKLGHLMHEAWLQSDLKQKSHELATAVQVMEKVLAQSDTLKARAEAAEAELARVRAVAIPTDVREAAQMLKDGEYRGPLAFAAKVIDFVADYTPPQPAAQEPTSAVPVVEQMGKSLERCVKVMRAAAEKTQDSVVANALYAMAEIAKSDHAAGQKFIKESGK